MLATSKSGTFRIGGDIPVHRMGFGAMRLTGPGIWGPPADEDNARKLLRRAAELGVDFIDTADVYGPDHSERLIREALHPYPEKLVIATKAGLVRTEPYNPKRPIPKNGSEAHIRKALEGSLRKLGVERIDLYQLHRIDPEIPVEETMRVFKALRDEGKIRHIGLSEVGVAEIERARKVVEIATVQNLYNLAARQHEEVLAYCEKHGIGFMPFYPLDAGKLATSEAMNDIVRRTKATPAQVALAWLLKKAPVMLLIPGTASVEHLEENIGACDVTLTDADMAALERLGKVA